MKYYLSSKTAAKRLGIDEESLPSFIKISHVKKNQHGRKSVRYSKWRATRTAKAMEKLREWNET